MTRSLSDILPDREAVAGIGDVYQTYGQDTALWFLEEFVGGMFVSCERCEDHQVQLETAGHAAVHVGVDTQPQAQVQGVQGRLL